MADKIGDDASYPQKRFKDMGDGTFAERVVAGLVDANGNDVGVGGLGYEAVGVSQTDNVLGDGVAGNYLEALILTPQDTSPGAVILKDGATEIWRWLGGTVSAALYPIRVEFGIAAVDPAGFSVTTPSDVKVLAVGTFTDPAA